MAWQCKRQLCHRTDTNHNNGIRGGVLIGVMLA